MGRAVERLLGDHTGGDVLGAERADRERLGRRFQALRDFSNQ